jgi:site-specific DNA-methyltransferase (adenine-specific)
MEMNKIYCDDNINFLGELSSSDVKVDLVVTDPPYNIGKDFGNDSDNVPLSVFLQRMKDRIINLHHCTAPGAGLVLFASHMYVAEINSLLKEESLSYKRQMIWYYKNGMSRQTRTPVTEYEPFLWFTWSEDYYTYNGDDVRVPYKSDRVKTPVYKKNKDGEIKAWIADPRGAKRGDVWEYPTLAGKLYEAERTEHPSQKPEALMTDIIKAFCPKNADGKYDGVVMDIYAGSGTVPVCCELLNRQGHNIRWLACEMEQKWVDVGNRRLERLREFCDGSIL